MRLSFVVSHDKSCSVDVLVAVDSSPLLHLVVSHDRSCSVDVLVAVDSSQLLHLVMWRSLAAYR